MNILNFFSIKRKSISFALGGFVPFSLIIIAYTFCGFPLLSSKATPSMELSDVVQKSILLTESTKKTTNDKVKKIWNKIAKVNLDSISMPFLDHNVVRSLEYQQEFLSKMKGKKINIGDRKVSADDLLASITVLLSWQYSFPGDLSEYFDFYEVNSSPSTSNVRFTGYYTPVVKVSKKRTARYKYPIYAYPQDWKGALPSRKQIDGDKALIDKDLELAYADNRIDIYYMQMQGSGIVQYPNGKRELFIYAGNNGHRFRSVNQFLQHSDEHDISNLTSIGIKKYLESNPSIIDSVLYEDKSYVFFERRPFSVPLGASNVPLTSTHSLAVDPKYIPLGSCLLGAVPTQKSGVLKHQLRFLVAQDVGGAIRGAGHVDLYCGMGKEAQEKADRTHHNGKLWIMLLKKDKVDLAQRNLAMR